MKRPELSRVTAFSAACHLLALILLTGVLHRAAQIAPYKLPGTALGVRMITYYRPGADHPASGELATKALEVPPAKPARTQPAAKDPAQTAFAEKGVGTTAQSGRGDGDITIALGKYFPPPRPDLSSLPHGTRGDVILDAVIDEQGAITDLKLVQGLGPAIDDAVIATVKQWSYTPAMKNGQPVASEQEFLFHYERS